MTLDKNDEAVRGALTRAIARLGHAPAIEALAAELARAGIKLDTGEQLRLFPHKHGCDGFYAEVLTRTS